MSKALVIQKAIGLVLVAAAITFLNPFQMLVAAIIFGHGHALAAYYYQWKAGKLKPLGVAKFACAALVLLSLAFITQALLWYTLTVILLFIVHHFQDEVLLFGKERSIVRTIEQLIPVAMYGALVIDALFGLHIAMYATIFALLLLVAYIVLIATRKYMPDVLSAYFLLIGTVLMGIQISGLQVPANILISSVILFHYVCWYVHFYYRFEKKPEMQSRYLREMIVINTIILFVYALYLYVPGLAPVLIFFFGPIYFYVWTIMHILSSLRRDDYRALVRWPSSS